jgi:MFS family permease
VGAYQRVRYNFRLDLACAAVGATFFAGSFMPVLVRRMGGSEIEVALVLASGPIGHILAPLPGYLYSRYAPAKVLASVGIAARLVFLAGLLLATSAISLSLAWVAFNVVALSGIASSTVLVQKIYPDEQRGQAMARVRMLANLVGMGSVVVGGALLEVGDVRTVLGASALISFASPLFLVFMRYHVDRERNPMPSPIRLGSVALQDTAFRQYLIATTFIGFGNAMGGTAYPIMLVDKFNAPTVLVGIMAAVQSAATIAGYHFWGRRIDRGSTVALLRVNAVMMLLLPLTYLVAPSAPFLLFGAIAAGVTNAMADLSFFTSMIELAGSRAGQYMAAQSFVLGVRATLAPFVASALLITVGAPITLLAVVACLGCGAVLVRGVRPAARTEALRVPAEAFAD